MALIGVQKQFRQAAEAMARVVKNPVLTEEEEENGFSSVTVEGDYQVLDPMELDMWGGRMQFVFRGKEHPDSEERDEDYYSLVGHIAAAEPALAAIMTSKATLQVFQKTDVKTEVTTTVNKKVWLNGKLSDKKGERGWESEAHKTTDVTEESQRRDITEEWAKRTQARLKGDW